MAEAVVAAGARPEQVEIASFGSRRPLRAGSSQEDLARNRRVELLLLEPMAVKGASEEACPAIAEPSYEAPGEPVPDEVKTEEENASPPTWAPEEQPMEAEDE